MTPLEEQYNNLIDPINFMKNFPEEEGFRIWLRGGTINDLKDTLKAFEVRELYEYCSIIQDEIDTKVDLMLSGFGFTD